MKTSGCEIIDGGTGGATGIGCFFRIGEKKCLSLDSFFTVGSLVVFGAAIDAIDAMTATGLQLISSLGLFIKSFVPFTCGTILAIAVMFPC